MNQTPVISRKIYARPLVRAGIFLSCVALALVFSSLLQPIVAFGDTVASGLLQENIGYRIQVLGRYDQERKARLQEQWARAVQQVGRLEAGQDARLQEALGQAIARTGQMILNEQARLRNAVIVAAKEVQKFQREKSSRRQEHLGMAILEAARRVPQGGDAFQAAFQKKANLLKEIDGRTGRRLESHLQALLTRQAEFPKTIPLLYQEATRSAGRSMRIVYESQISWTSRVLNGLKEELAWRRQSEDHVRLADAVGEILLGLRRESEYEGYGLSALAGLVLAMLWVAFITRGDNLGSNVSGPRSTTEPGKTYESNLWRKEAVARAQRITLFSRPKEVIFGDNVAQEVGRYAAKDNNQQAIIITDQGVHQCGLLNPVRSSFSRAGVGYKVYDQVRPEVQDTVIMELLDECNQNKVDLLVAVGGGSVIDTAKAVGILMTNGGRIQDYEGADKIFRAIPCFYVVPTTAGCGSEASQFCVVLDTKRKKKIEIFSRKIIPQMIFIDPMLTLTMPIELTASSGIDALANCIEAYFSTWASPLTDALSLHAIRLISGSLRAAVANGMNLEARQEMAMAAFEAGLAFTNAHAGAVHALGHPIAGLFNVPQRLGNAILLPHVMRHNMNANMDRMVDVAVAMGEPVSSLSKHDAAERGILAVQCLMLDIGLPTTLDKVGVIKEGITELSQQALEDAFLKTNPCILNKRDIEHIYERAFEEYSGAVHTSSVHHREMVH